jgi:hypothetical protein
MLSGILEKGILQYGWELYIKRVEREIRERVMRRVGITEQDLREMPDDQRAALEREIEKQVAEGLKAHLKSLLELRMASRGDDDRAGGDS